jgi:RNA polymerase sigma factor (sigma-70 family)
MGSKEGGEDAFRRIYESYYRHISAYARRRVDEADAEDVVAETFLVAWRRLDQVPEGDRTLPWLYGVARRVLSQLHRGGRRRGRLIARLETSRQETSLDMEDLGRVDDQQLVRAALSRLREPDREILRLSEWEDLSPAQLAVVLDCSTNAVTIRLHRARKRFGKALSVIDAAVEPGDREESK